MSDDKARPGFAVPVSAFGGPVAELIAQGMLSPPTRPGVLATVDEFEILRLLGSGGMGIVLLARDSKTGAEAALKMIKADLVGNQTVVYRFLKEAGHLKRLTHPNVISVTAISDRPAGPYFVMPFYEKGSLATRIRPGQPLDGELALHIALQVAEGLSFAHRNGIIHRDLKPANILLTAKDVASLADFGLARTFFNDTLVEVGNRNMEGTAPYMSPAVAAGDAEDTRCDIYSFGALLYEMLTGLPPYQGRSAQAILEQIIAGPPKPILEMNPSAERRVVVVAEGCMARELRDRYADMRDVLSDLRRIRENKDPIALRGATAEVKGRRRELAVLGAAACLAGLAIAGWWRWHHAAAPLIAKAPAVAPANFPPLATNPPPPPATNTNTPPSPPATNTPPPPPSPPVWHSSLLAGLAGSSGFADGVGREARFQLPNSVAADQAGNVYVADTGNHAIRKIAPDGAVTTLAGLGSSSGSADGDGLQARFSAPFGVAVDAAGNVFVADTMNNTIRKITPAGTVTTLAGQAGQPGSNDGSGQRARFRNPWGLTVDGQGNVLVADTSNNTIRKITPAGVVATVAGIAGTNGVADGAAAAARFNAPYAVATDPAGNIYVADSGNNCIRKISTKGIVSTFAGLPGYPSSVDGKGDYAGFSFPQGLAADGQGNIYVADTGNQLIRKVTAEGVVTTLAGMAGVSGTNDSVGAAVRFSNPAGVAVDKAGNLYVADTGNQVVRKLVFGPAPKT